MNRKLLAREILIAGIVIFQATALFAQPKAGEEPPPITLEKLLQAPDDSGVSWEALRGKVVVLEFWTTWCGPCVAAIPHLNRLAETFEDRPVQFIAITDEDEEKISSFLERRSMRAWIGLDANRATFEAYGVRGIPHTVLVGTDGLIDAITHPTALTETHIESLLAGGESGLPRVVKERGNTVPAGEVKDADGEPLFFQVMLRPSTGTDWSNLSGPSGKNSLGVAYGATMKGHTLEEMLPSVYRVHPSRIMVETELPDGTYDLFLKLPRDRSSEADHFRQQAIETTFALSSRREMREMEAFVLSVKEPNAKGLLPTATPETMSSSSRAGAISGVNIKLDSVVWALQTGLGKPVIDETELSGGFDVDLHWEQEDYETPNPTALIEAVREQLGLELTAVSRPVEVLIIDSQ